MKDADIKKDDLRDSTGEYYQLKLTMNIPVEKYVPPEIDYPNSFRYLIISHNTEDPRALGEVRLIEDYDYKEIVIKKLKEIHGIVDPWDLEPEKYRKKWEETPWTGYDENDWSG
ncbi:MAG: hypothetical protein ABUK01_08600 [Leptospirales bacterium]